jgi:hypothetical protein
LAQKQGKTILNSKLKERGGKMSVQGTPNEQFVRFDQETDYSIAQECAKGTCCKTSGPWFLISGGVGIASISGPIGQMMVCATDSRALATGEILGAAGTFLSVAILAFFVYLKCRYRIGETIPSNYNSSEQMTQHYQQYRCHIDGALFLATLAVVANIVCTILVPIVCTAGPNMTKV